jgi:hypothetical protein
VLVAKTFKWIGLPFSMAITSVGGIGAVAIAGRSIATVPSRITVDLSRNFEKCRVIFETGMLNDKGFQKPFHSQIQQRRYSFD